MHLLPHDRFGRALAALSAAEVLLIALGWFASSPPALSLERIAGASGLAGDASASGLALLPRDSFQAFTQRPLFVAARRPSPQAAQGAPASDGVAFGRYRFTGVAVTPKLRIAFVTDAETNRSLAVSEGDRLGDWTILEIKREGLTLQSQGRQETVLFRRP